MDGVQPILWVAGQQPKSGFVAQKGRDFGSGPLISLYRDVAFGLHLIFTINNRRIYYYYCFIMSCCFCYNPVWRVTSA